jgi:ABC-type Fe3+/spermidine/putrescine transport system ATPase subunit
MLDEPLASLDRDLSTRLAKELRTILTTLGMTALYVTHDQQEAFAVADTIAIMQSGSITARDEPRRLRENPVDESTARFLGLGNIYEVLGGSADGSAVETAFGLLPAPSGPLSLPQIVLRPEAVVLRPGCRCRHTPDGTARRARGARLAVGPQRGARWHIMD